MSFYIELETVLRIFTGIAIGISLLNFVGVVVRNTVGNFYLERILLGLTDFENGFSLVTWYESSAWLFCALLCLMLALAGRRFRDRYSRHWLGLGGICLLLSLDRVTNLHHAIRHDLLYRLPQSVDISPVTLTLIQGIVLLCLGLAYIPFFRSLPRLTQRLLLRASGLFLMGAVGLDWMSKQVQVPENLGFSPLLSSIEALEALLEMLGLALLVHSLLTHLQVSWLAIQLLFKPHQSH